MNQNNAWDFGLYHVEKDEHDREAEKALDTGWTISQNRLNQIHPSHERQ